MNTLLNLSDTMTPENKKSLWAYIRKAGDNLDGKLPQSPRHPKGRNPYAHIAKCIKSKYGRSYGELSDDDYDDVVRFIDYLVENPF